LVSLNVQKASMNVNGCIFFCMEELFDTPHLHTHFHVRRDFARLLLCCCQREANLQTTTITPAFAPNV
jgi:hypothetical protein